MQLRVTKTIIILPITALYDETLQSLESPKRGQLNLEQGIWRRLS